MIARIASSALVSRGGVVNGVNTGPAPRAVVDSASVPADRDGSPMTDSTVGRMTSPSTYGWKSTGGTRETSIATSNATSGAAAAAATCAAAAITAAGAGAGGGASSGGSSTRTSSTAAT